MQLNKSKNIPLLFLVFSIFYTSQLNFLYFVSVNSPDFEEYLGYIKFFFNLEASTGREQGLFYYYIQSLALNSDILNSVTTQSSIVLHQSIQLVNNVFFIIGITGIYKIMKYLKIDTNKIFISLAALCFFPPSITLRIVYKPEIVAFALFPWVILFLEKYINEKKIMYLMQTIPLITILLASKGSILAMVLIYLTAFYLVKVINVNKKIFLLSLILLICSFTLISYEDSSANNRGLLEIESGATTYEKYDYKAPPKVAYNINLFKLFTSPIRDNHNDSFIAITLLDTFGDYFNVYWDNNGTGYFQDRKSVIIFENSNEIKAPKFNSATGQLTIYLQKETDIYLRPFTGVALSVIFYALIFLKILQKSKFRIFLLSPIVGMLILLIHSITGFPQNNFDPLVGDTFKTYYYSFLLCFAFCFLLVELLKNRVRGYFVIVVFIFLSIFSLGFPKEYKYELSNEVLAINTFSPFCELNNLLLLNNLKSDIEFDCNSSENVKGYTKKHSELFPYDGVRFSLVNLLFGILSISSILFEIFKSKMSYKNMDFLKSLFKRKNIKKEYNNSEGK